MLRKLTTFVSHGSIKEGKLQLDNERYFKGMVATYADTENVRITVEKVRGTRSQRQNAYYWGVVLKYIAEYMGEHAEDLHEIMKAKFLKKRRVWRGGEMTILQSTSKLTSDEMATYIDRVIQEGAELGVVVPMADKEYRVKQDFHGDI